MPSVNKNRGGLFVLIKLTALTILWPHSTGQIPSCPEICRCSSQVSTEVGDTKPQIAVVCSGNIENLSLLDFPRHVNYLDLTETSLHTIPSYYFIDRGLTELSEMDLSSNNLSHIYADMFVGLNKLQYLDLSYNKILHLDPGSLIYNEMLSHLYLRGTGIPIDGEGSIVVSRSLKLLDVSYCGLRALPELVFSELPYLEVLNVSWNPLSNLDVRVFDNLEKLRELDITRTYIRCDKTLAPLTAWGAERSVKINGFPCLNSHQDSPRFISHRRTTTDNQPEWETPSSVEEEGEETRQETSDLQVTDDPDSLIDSATKSSKPADFTRRFVEDFGNSTDGTSDEETTSTLFGISIPLPQITGTLLIACIGGFGLGIAVAICITATIYCFYCKSPEDETNEVVSAGEDFQLVHTSSMEGPIIREPPPSYSSLFSSRYQKVLPTAPRWAR